MLLHAKHDINTIETGTSTFEIAKEEMTAN